MAFDTPRTTDITGQFTIRRGDENAAVGQALQPRTALLALAGDLADVGARCSLADGGPQVAGIPPAVLRCWNPSRNGESVTLTCTPGPDGRLQVRYHPGGDDLGDAETLLQPGTKAGGEMARTIAAGLKVRPLPGRGDPVALGRQT